MAAGNKCKKKIICEKLNAAWEALNDKIFKSEQSPHAGSQGSHHAITIGPKFKALCFLVRPTNSHHGNHSEMKDSLNNRYDRS